MRTRASYIRFIIFIGIAFVVLSFSFSEQHPISAATNGIFWIVLLVVVTIGLAGEICVGALKGVLFGMLSEEKQQAILQEEAYKKAHRYDTIKAIYKKLVGSKPIEEEHEIILDHNYDGIKELDNNLPPWWVYAFYASILFAVVYMVRFEVFGDYNQAEEYEVEVAEAQKAINEWKKTAKNLVDENTVTLLAEAEDLKIGKTIFGEKCVACHKADGGGGIGPNLTDEYWILGGGIKEVFHTISEGGRSAKGMVAWKTELKPLEIAQVASYVLSLQGTTPAAPKEPQGEIWKDPNSVEQSTENTVDTQETKKLSASVNY